MSGQSVRDEGSEREARQAAATGEQGVAAYLIGCAARKAPPGLRERLQEEWLADLMARRGAFSRVRFALGCCWATRVIAREFGAAVASAGSSASGQRVLASYGGYDFSRLPRRTTALIAIVCLHLAVFYAYVSGLGQKILPPPAEPLHAIPLDEQPRKLVPPAPLPSPRLAHRFAEHFPTPLVIFKFPAQETAITVAHSPRPDMRQLPVAPVKRVIGGPGAGFPDTEDYYPPSARRLGETGTTVVSVCVDPRGTLTAAPTILDSSGIRQIDEGALRLARAGSGHYRPTTENGQPVSACYAFRIRFQLEDQ
jgi:protein TonB